MTDPIARLNAALEGRYRIERELGSGGMATVYRADDLRHERKVAIKVLRPELAAVIGAERFLAEIRTTANLQHPHILPLFDSGEADGFLFYVMPYVDGESLREKIDREKQLLVEEAVRLTTEVAQALEHAHARGVIHRDIKPANILLQDGRALVADFGIALAVSAAGGARLTETGLSVGTPYYMSPEQAAGDRELDGRSDLYSLACIAYEMLAGEPPHTGTTAQAVFAKILTDDPRPLSKLRRAVPPGVEASVHCALQKLPADRFSSLTRFAGALTGAEATALPASRVTPDATASGRWIRDPRSWLSVAGLLILGGGWMSTLGSTDFERPYAPGVVRSVIARSEHVTFGVPVAVSPDGGTVVFVGGENGRRQLYRRRLDDLSATPIVGTEGATNPFFSPDGEWVGFTRNWGIYKVRLDGGGVSTVRPDSVGEGGGATWWGGWIHYWAMGSEQVHRIPDEGGVPELVENPELQGRHNLVSRSHLPDGTLLVTDWRYPPRLGVLDIATGALRVDSASVVFGPRFVPPSTLVFGRPDGTLLAARFDPAAAEITGQPVTIATDVEVSNWWPLFAVSPQGTIVYVRDEPDELLFDPLNSPARPITDERQNYHLTAAVSPDGSSIAVVARDGMGEQLRVYDEDGRGQFLTRDQQVHHPIWTPDGQAITYGWWDRGMARISAQGGEPTFLLEGPGTWQPAAWDPGGERLAFMNLEDYQSPLLLHGETGEVVPFSSVPEGLGAADYSPDGSLVAYQSLRLESFQIWLQPATGGVPEGTPVRMSFEGGIAPHFSEDGNSLFYIRWRAEEPQTAHLVRVDIRRSPLGPGEETVLDDWSGDGIDSAYRFDIHPSGELVRIRTAPKRDVVLLQNWQALLDSGTS